MWTDWTVLTRWRSLCLGWWSLSWTLSSFLVFFVFCFLLQRLSFFFFFKLCLSNGFCFLLCLIYQGLVKTPIKDMSEEVDKLIKDAILRSDNELLESGMKAGIKKIHRFRFKDKACEKQTNRTLKIGTRNLTWCLRFLLKLLKKCQWSQPILSHYFS